MSHGGGPYRNQLVRGWMTNIARACCVMVCAPLVMALVAQMRFTGVADDTGETVTGFIQNSDDDAFDGEASLRTSRGVSCKGPYRQMTRMHAEAHLSCSDGRSAFIRLSFYGRNIVSEATIDGVKLTLSMPGLPHRSR